MCGLFLGLVAGGIIGSRCCERRHDHCCCERRHEHCCGSHHNHCCGRRW